MVLVQYIQKSDLGSHLNIRCGKRVHDHGYLVSEHLGWPLELKRSERLHHKIQSFEPRRSSRPWKRNVFGLMVPTSTPDAW